VGVPAPRTIHWASCVDALRPRPGRSWIGTRAVASPERCRVVSSGWPAGNGLAVRNLEHQAPNAARSTRHPFRAVRKEGIWWSRHGDWRVWQQPGLSTGPHSALRAAPARNGRWRWTVDPGRNWIRAGTSPQAATAIRFVNGANWLEMPESSGPKLCQKPKSSPGGQQAGSPAYGGPQGQPSASIHANNRPNRRKWTNLRASLL